MDCPKCKRQMIEISDGNAPDSDKPELTHRETVWVCSPCGGKITCLDFSQNATANAK